MNQITLRGTTALSTEDDNKFAAMLGEGLLASNRDTPLAGGVDLLRLLKNGVWVFGQGDAKVQKGSEWAINVRSLAHGWTCWSSYADNRPNQKLGEVMAPAWEAKPPMPAPIQGFPFKEARSFGLICLNGDDEGTEVTYSNASDGALRACVALFNAINAQARKSPRHIYPVVSLQTDSYNHVKWGQIFKPIFEIVAWLDKDLREEGDEAPAIPARTVPEPPISAQQPEVIEPTRTAARKATAAMHAAENAQTAPEAPAAPRRAAAPRTAAPEAPVAAVAPPRRQRPSAAAS